MTTYRLGSSAMVHTPGVIAWAINGYAFETDRDQLLKTVSATFAGVPVTALRQLLSKEIPFTVEGETVVFTADETREQAQ